MPGPEGAVQSMDETTEKLFQKTNKQFKIDMSIELK